MEVIQHIQSAEAAGLPLHMINTADARQSSMHV